MRHSAEAPHCHLHTQLDDSNGGRRLDWLPLEGLSKQIRTVISTLPDELSPPDGRPFRCLSQLERRLVGSDAGGGRREAASETTDLSRLAREHQQVFVRVEPLKDAADLLRHLLKLQGRCATGEQIDRIVEAVNSSDHTQTPLLVTILAQWVSQWHSYDDLSRVTVPTSVRDVILGFFQRLEKTHGEKLVRAALSFITLAKQGVSETELQELLSLDDEVLADVYQWYATHGPSSLSFEISPSYAATATKDATQNTPLVPQFGDSA